MGVPSEDSSLHALAAAHGIEGIPAEAGSEGYVVAIDETSVFVLANTAAGVYYGAASLLQLAAVPQESPLCNLVDWPDFPIRGAYMFGGPKLTPDSPDPLQWHMNLADWMSQHKMNFGVVVAHFYDIVPSLVPNATAIRYDVRRRVCCHTVLVRPPRPSISHAHSPSLLLFTTTRDARTELCLCCHAVLIKTTTHVPFAHDAHALTQLALGTTACDARTEDS